MRFDLLTLFTSLPAVRRAQIQFTRAHTQNSLHALIFSKRVGNLAVLYLILI